MEKDTIVYLLREAVAAECNNVLAVHNRMPDNIRVLLEQHSRKSFDTLIETLFPEKK